MTSNSRSHIFLSQILSRKRINRYDKVNVVKNTVFRDMRLEMHNDFKKIKLTTRKITILRGIFKNNLCTYRKVKKVLNIN